MGWERRKSAGKGVGGKQEELQVLEAQRRVFQEGRALQRQGEGRNESFALAT